jgi:hypothetical protein
MKHFVYTKTAFGEVVEQTICLHVKPEEMKALISLAYIGATAPGEVEPENKRLIDALDSALADAEDGKGFSNTEIPDF